MSIAVSAVIKPSRLLFILVGGMGVILLGVAGLFAMDAVSSLSLTARLVIAGLCAAVAVTVFFWTIWRSNNYVIHISGTGQIRLATGNRNEKALVDETTESELVHLMAGSTIWSGLLLLHLQNERKQTTIVTILPDTVSADSFRALLVACRWIVLRRIDSELDVRH